MQSHEAVSGHREPAEQTQACVRCGAPVPVGIALCERCNPLGLTQPTSTQAHGTILLAIVISVVALALLGRFALSGIGPFSATVARVEPIHDGLAITLSVTNEGGNAGSTFMASAGSFASWPDFTICFTFGSSQLTKRRSLPACKPAHSSTSGSHVRDDVCAWAIFGALTFGGRAAAELLSEPAAPDQTAGAIGVVLVALAVAALCAGRRRPATVPAPQQPEGSS